MPKAIFTSTTPSPMAPLDPRADLPVKVRTITVGVNIFPDGPDPHAYGVIVEGDCMQPAVFNGEMVIVSPAAQPRPGDMVLLRPADGSQPQLKRLVMVTPANIRSAAALAGSDLAGLIVVETLNPRRQLTMPTRKLHAVHRVIHVYREEEIPALRTPTARTIRRRSHRAGGRA